MSSPDWSTLPPELLHSISLLLPTPTSLLSFRSTCSTWRSSTPPPLSPTTYPILPNSGISDSSWGFRLSKRIIYSLSSPLPRFSSKSWMIKLEKSNYSTRLLFPLTRSQPKPLPSNFPNPFNFFNVRVKELGHEFTLQYINFRPSASNVNEAGNLYMEKVALYEFNINNNNNNNDDDDGGGGGGGNGFGFVLVTIHVSGKLVVFKSGGEKWKVINDLPSPYDDVVVRKGGVFYAVDNTGRLVVVDVGELRVEVVAGAIFGGDKKFLVEDEGVLMLVDMYLSIGPEEDLGYGGEGVEFYEEFDCFMSERTVKFKVFRLDEGVGKWVEVSDLGDKMLFLGDNCLFVASVEEFRGYGGEWKGNRIYFTDHSCSREDDRVWKGHGIAVFDLESGSIGPMGGDDDGYCKMFWPPPDWVYSVDDDDADDSIEVSSDGRGSVKNMRFPDLWQWKSYPLMHVLFGLFIAVLTTALWQILLSLNL